MNFKPNVIKYKSKQSESTEIICIVAFCDIINVNIGDLWTKQRFIPGVSLDRQTEKRLLIEWKEAEPVLRLFFKLVLNFKVKLKAGVKVRICHKQCNNMQVTGLWVENHLNFSHQPGGICTWTYPWELWSW